VNGEPAMNDPTEPRFLSRQWFLKNGNNWRGITAGLVLAILMLAILAVFTK
jgi:tetrahydromethanopterin S-methyltransferase subunit F